MAGVSGGDDGAGRPGQLRLARSVLRRRWLILAAVLLVGAGFGLRAAFFPGRPLAIDTGEVGPGPVSVSPNGSTLYMASFGSEATTASRPACYGLLETFSTETGRLGWTLQILDGGPQAMVLAPDGRTIYVLTCTGMVVPVNAATGEPGTPIRTADRPAENQGPEIAITPDGRTLFVAGKYLIPISTTTRKTGTPIRVTGSSPVISPDGRTLYLAANGKAGSTITRVDLDGDRRYTPIQLPGSVYDMLVSPDSRTLYVAGSHGIEAVNATTGAAGAFLETRYRNVASMVITPGSRTLYAAGWRAGIVLPISLRTGKRAAPIRITRDSRVGCPDSLALSHDTLYVTNAGPSCMDQEDGNLAIIPISG